MINAGKLLLSSTLIFAMAVAPVVARAESDCFERKDSQRLVFDLFQISAPPPYSTSIRDYAESGPVYPASDYAAAPNRFLREKTPVSATGFEFRKHYLLWANRCTYLVGITPDETACRNTKRTKGNGYPNMAVGPLNNQLRTGYSTYKKANACTLLNARSILGEKWEVIVTDALASGLTIASSSADRGKLASMARTVLAGSAGEKMTYLVDTCIVDPEAMSADTTGIVLDYEVFDNRTPAEALAFFRELHELVKRNGKTLIVNTNPLPREPNGINSTNVRDILNMVDGLAPTISSGASVGNPDTFLAKQQRRHSPIDSYKLQLGVLTDNGRVPLTLSMRQKIIWNVSLYDTELSEARQLHDEVVVQKYRGIMIFRNYIKQGGACSRANNQVTACLAFGECSGAFGTRR